MSFENALARAIRMRRPEDALYWYSRLRDGGATSSKAVRILFLAACRDNLDTGLMAQTEQCAAGSEAVNKHALVLGLASSEKLWSIEEGRKLIRVIAHCQTGKSWREYSDEELLMKLDAALDPGDGETPRLADAVGCAAELMGRAKMFGRELFGRMVDRLGARASGSEATETVYRMLTGNGEWLAKTTAEETLVYLLIAWIADGAWGQQAAMAPDHDVAFVRVARRLRNEERLPPWASVEDRRFESSWYGYANMAEMVEKHGRLDPEDDGVIFRVRNGRWAPVVREEDGVYLVQSQENPERFYEVNLATASCTCEDFYRRGRECKHQLEARQFAEEQLPFEVV